MHRTDAKRMQVLQALGNTNGNDAEAVLLAAQVMTAAPSCISPETTVLELIDLFHAKQFRHLLVTDAAGRLIGLVSDRDVIRCLGPSRPDKSVLAGIRTTDIMSTDLVTISPATPLSKAVTLMVDHGISCLPVLADGTLVGILTNTDLYLVLQVLLQTLRQSSLEESTISASAKPQN